MSRKVRPVAATDLKEPATVTCPPGFMPTMSDEEMAREMSRRLVAARMKAIEALAQDARRTSDSIAEMRKTIESRKRPSLREEEILDVMMMRAQIDLDHIARLCEAILPKFTLAG